MHASLFDYELPKELIAQKPVEPRDSSRLLVIHRETGTLEHRHFYDLPDYLHAGDTLVLNDTRVSAWRLLGHKTTGGQVETLLLKPLGQGLWQALVKPGRRLQVGAQIHFEHGVSAIITERHEDGTRTLCFTPADELEARLPHIAQVPLPPYIHHALTDLERYQTVYAKRRGSAAAPTAGLHFTPNLLRALEAQGVRLANVTLHVSLDTFRPLQSESIEEHKMHGESFEVSEEAAGVINSTPGKVVAVGTTAIRTLESSAIAKSRVQPKKGETSLYIQPGYEFQVVQGIVTNFHLPRTTMLVLISAFTGIELLMKAYREAVHQQYRFLSFGDAMLIL